NSSAGRAGGRDRREIPGPGAGGGGRGAAGATARAGVDRAAGGGVSRPDSLDQAGQADAGRRLHFEDGTPGLGSGGESRGRVAAGKEIAVLRAAAKSRPGGSWLSP